MLKVYGHLSSGNCYKIYLALKQLHIPFEWINVDAVKRETRSAEFLAMNPNGKVPLLEIAPGQYLPESNAILHYLAEGTALCPTDRYQHAQVLQWLFFEQYSHEPYIATSRFVMHFLGNPAERQADMERWRKPGYAALDVMNRHLESRRFFVGDTYSIADIALYAYTHVAPEGGFDLSKYEAALAWLERVKAQPDHVGMNQ
ncbi:MAG: glutathione S-transferase family protein [Burkholderiaceae bacterium]